MSARTFKWIRRAVWWLGVVVLWLAIVHFGYWVVVPILAFYTGVLVEDELRCREKYAQLEASSRTDSPRVVP